MKKSLKNPNSHVLGRNGAKSNQRGVDNSSLSQVGKKASQSRGQNQGQRRNQGQNKNFDYDNTAKGMNQNQNQNRSKAAGSKNQNHAANEWRRNQSSNEDLDVSRYHHKDVDNDDQY